MYIYAYIYTLCVCVNVCQNALPAVLFFGAWWALLFMIMMMASLPKEVPSLLLGTKSPSPHSLSAAISFLDHAFSVLE